MKINHYIVDQIRPHYIFIIFAIVIGINSLIFVDSLRRALLYQVEFTYGEAGTLYLAQHPDLLYDQIDESPYIISFYTPLYYLVVSALDRISNRPFLVGRTVSVVASLGTVGLITGTVSSLNPRSKLAPAIAAALFFLSPIVARKFAIYARVDMLGLLFSAAAIYWFVSRRGGVRIAGCIGLCLLAGLTKQSLIAAPIAILLAFIWKRSWRDTILFAVGGGTIVGIAAFALIDISEGGVISHLLVYNRAAGFFLNWGAKQYMRLLGIYFPLIIVTIVAVWRSRDAIPPVIGAYALVGTLVAGVLLFRRGAALNHTFEALVGVVLIAGLAIAEMTPRLDGWVRNTSISFEPLVVWVLLLVIGQLFLYGFLGAFVATAPSPSSGEIGAAETIADADGPVISSDVGVVVRAGVQTDMNDPAFTHYLLNRGLWDTDSFLLRVRQQKYSYIVLGINISNPQHGTFWTEQELDAISSHYQQVFHRGRYWVYAPKDE